MTSRVGTNFTFVLFLYFQITALVQQHPGDLEAVEKEAAEEGHS